VSGDPTQPPAKTGRERRPTSGSVIPNAGVGSTADSQPEDAPLQKASNATSAPRSFTLNPLPKTPKIPPLRKLGFPTSGKFPKFFHPPRQLSVQTPYW